VCRATFLKLARHCIRFSNPRYAGAVQIGQKTREVVAEAHEQIQDIVAEVDAEKDLGSTTSKAKQATGSLD
jgi:hypothetical protein